MRQALINTEQELTAFFKEAFGAFDKWRTAKNEEWNAYVNGEKHSNWAAHCEASLKGGEDTSPQLPVGVAFKRKGNAGWSVNVYWGAGLFKHAAQAAKSYKEHLGFIQGDTRTMTLDDLVEGALASAKNIKKLQHMFA